MEHRERIAAIDLDETHRRRSSDDPIRDGVDPRHRTDPTVRIARACLRDAVVPASFPLHHADAPATGCQLTVDQRFFDDRRRSKTPRELEGIERASRAAEAGTAAIAAALARSEPGEQVQPTAA
jgi:hypothetical protein